MREFGSEILVCIGGVIAYVVGLAIITAILFPFLHILNLVARAIENDVGRHPGIYIACVSELSILGYWFLRYRFNTRREYDAAEREYLHGRRLNRIKSRLSEIKIIHEAKRGEMLLGLSVFLCLTALTTAIYNHLLADKPTEFHLITPFALAIPILLLTLGSIFLYRRR